MAQLKLEILGGFRLFGTDGQARQLPTRKAEALLAYLAMPHGRSHRREHLATVLWGDRGHKQARHSLNQTVFSIRKAVAEPGMDPLRAQGESLALNPEIVAVDAALFEQLAAARDPSLGREIAELYRGDLLEGLNLKAEAFDEWLIAERLRLRELATAALDRLLQAQLAAGEHDAGVHTALRLLAADPLLESVHRDLMRIYAAQGRHAAALRQYEVCEAVLQRELGVPPQAETRDLQGAIAAQRTTARPDAVGTAVAAPAPPLLATGVAVSEQTAPPAARQPERKHLTVLCADVAAGGDAGTDPEAGLQFLDPVMEVVAGLIARYRGTISNRQSHAVTALFGAPLADEDHAVRACYAGLALRDAVLEESAGQLRPRVGLHSGEAVVRPAAGDGGGLVDAVGPAVGLAGQVLNAMPADAIGLSAATRQAAQAYVTSEPAGQTVPGLPPGGGEVYRLTGRSGVTQPWQARLARGLTDFVGREHELALLTQTLDRAGSGHGQLIAVIGDAGVGKSRLVHEFANTEALANWQVLRAGAFALETATAFGVISQLLRAWCAIDGRDSQAEVADKVRQRLLGLDRALAPALPVVFALLDVPVEDEEWQTLNPAQRRRRTLSCLKAVLSRLSQERPLLIILEDLHWIDPETQTVLDTLVEGLAAQPLLLLVTYRPEYRHDWTGRSGFSFVRLEPLADDSAGALLDSLLGEDESVGELRRLLIERTRGTPLFLEESVRTLAEAGSLTGAPGAYRLSGKLDAIDIPTSVQAVLAARIDRLPARSKTLLQTAAVVGMEVPDGLLRAIARMPEEDYYQAVATLQSAGFISEVRQLPDVEYAFCHALTHDVAYHGLLHEQRRALHISLVRHLEQRYRGRRDEQIERLAHHAVAGELMTEAVDYLYRAALKAIRRSAHDRAIGHLERALALLDAMPENTANLRRELDCRKAMGVTMMAARGWGAQEVSDAYTRAREISETIGDERELFVALRGQGQFHMIRGELGTARALGERCATLAAAAEDDGVQLETDHLFWSNSFFRGDYAEASAHAGAGIGRYHTEAHHHLTYVYSGHDPGVCCRAFSGLALWQQGYPERALQRCQEALDLAEQVAHPLTTALAHWALSYLHLFRQEPAEARLWAEREIGVCRDYLLPLLLSQGTFQLGWARARQGALRAGIAGMEDGLAHIRATGAEMGLPYFVALLGEAYALDGDLERGRQLIDQAVATARRSGAYFGYPEMLRLKGELALMATPADAAGAEAAFAAAMDAAQGQGARLPQLRAAVSLGELWTRQDRAGAAKDLVRPLYDGFDEGHESADLQRALALLDS